MANQYKFWLLKTVPSADSFSGEAETIWIFRDWSKEGIEFRMIDQNSQSEMRFPQNLEVAINTIAIANGGSGQIILSWSEWSMNGINWGQQHVVCTFDEWLNSESFATANNIGQTRDQLVSYLQEVLCKPSKPKSPKLFLVTLSLIILIAWLIYKQ
jgi:hypothetical protein